MNSIETIPRTNLSYLGWEETINNKEKLDRLNSQFDLKIDETTLKNPFQEYENIERSQIVREKEETQHIITDTKKEIYMDEIKTKSATDIEKTIKLAHVMQHNVLQNIPTHEIMKLRSTNI